MRCRNMHHWILPLCFGMAVGCQATDEPASEAAAAAAAPVRRSTGTTAKESKPAASAAQPTDPSQPAAIAEFAPPFPDRLELFEPPRRAQGTIRRDDQNGETVELKGFVNVDQPRVVLSIDGVILPIPEGGEKYGVQVISIQPPSVVLQRGRSRWTATLE